ncbi:hypothetical protein SAMN05421823_104557 [Catalinimonas alkaloidigena]|uniref:Lipoprotein n=1 Tax=Catalinimonas alkaloidigena TaxID=1075417 RepID=A0A1G9HVX7_9BACT|nr:hypothetical protein [Catalinimonas alkaloidigena]SDL17109.1 hypothetical protein SAMN05421823_104557 [Catalinimonas alkaloidigena]
MKAKIWIALVVVMSVSACGVRYCPTYSKQTQEVPETKTAKPRV